MRERFLLTRLIADELRLYASVLGSQAVEVPGMLVGLGGEHRDPVCGMRIHVRDGRRLAFDRHDYFFCSESCEHEFAADPERFLRAQSVLPQVRRARRWFTRHRDGA